MGFRVKGFMLKVQAISGLGCNSRFRIRLQGLLYGASTKVPLKAEGL